MIPVADAVLKFHSALPALSSLAPATLLAVALALGLGLAGCTTVPVVPPPVSVVVPAPLHVKLLAFNDFHGNLKTPSNRVPVPDSTQSTGIRFDPAGGVAQFGALIKSLKAKTPNVAVVSAGDMVGATPLLSALFKDRNQIKSQFNDIVLK